MAKNGEVKKNINVAVKGILNIENMTVTVEKNIKQGDEIVTITNVYTLEDLLEEFDEKFISLNCKYVEDLEEEDNEE